MQTPYITQIGQTYCIIWIERPEFKHRAYLKTIWDTTYNKWKSAGPQISLQLYLEMLSIMVQLAILASTNVNLVFVHATDDGNMETNTQLFVI